MMRPRHSKTLRRDGAKPMKHRVTLASIERILIHMSAQLERLTASVAQLKTVDESAAALLSNIAQQLRDAATDPAAINKLADDIDANNAALSAAVAANTPAAAALPGDGSGAGSSAPPADSGTPAA